MDTDEEEDGAEGGHIPVEDKAAVIFSAHTGNSINYYSNGFV